MKINSQIKKPHLKMFPIKDIIVYSIVLKSSYFYDIKIQTSNVGQQKVESFIRKLVGCWLVVWVLWHIKLCRSFNAKFCLYMHTYSTKDFKTNIKVGRIFF